MDQFPGTRRHVGEFDAMTTSVFLLMTSFVLSLAGLFVFIASMSRGLFGPAEQGSRVIFAPDEENITEDPAASPINQARLQAEVRVGTEAEPPSRVRRASSPDPRGRTALHICAGHPLPATESPKRSVQTAKALLDAGVTRQLGFPPATQPSPRRRDVSAPFSIRKTVPCGASSAIDTSPTRGQLPSTMRPLSTRVVIP